MVAIITEVEILLINIIRHVKEIEYTQMHFLPKMLVFIHTDTMLQTIN